MFAKSECLAGVGAYALDLDDFSGFKCGQGNYPLLHVIRDALRAPSTNNCEFTTTPSTAGDEHVSLNGQQDSITRHFETILSVKPASRHLGMVLNVPKERAQHPFDNDPSFTESTAARTHVTTRTPIINRFTITASTKSGNDPTRLHVPFTFTRRPAVAFTTTPAIITTSVTSTGYIRPTGGSRSYHSQNSHPLPGILFGVIDKDDEEETITMENMPSTPASPPSALPNTVKTPFVWTGIKPISLERGEEIQAETLTTSKIEGIQPHTSTGETVKYVPLRIVNKSEHDTEAHRLPQAHSETNREIKHSYITGSAPTSTNISEVTYSNLTNTTNEKHETGEELEVGAMQPTEVINKSTDNIMHSISADEPRERVIDVFLHATKFEGTSQHPFTAVETTFSTRSASADMFVPVFPSGSKSIVVTRPREETFSFAATPTVPTTNAIKTYNTIYSTVTSTTPTSLKPARSKWTVAMSSPSPEPDDKGLSRITYLKPEVTATKHIQGRAQNTIEPSNTADYSHPRIRDPMTNEVLRLKNSKSIASCIGRQLLVVELLSVVFLLFFISGVML